MLNRRTLRVKAMQAIYAFHQSRESDLVLAGQQVQQSFKDELNLQGINEKMRLAAEEEQALTYLKQNAQLSPQELPALESEKLTKIGRSAVVDYQQRVARDLDRIRKRMVDETEQLGTKYLRLLQQTAALTAYTKRHQEEKKFRVTNADREQKLVKLLYDNPAAKRLRTLQPLHQALESHGIKPNIDQVREWYRLLRQDEEFFKDQPAETPDAEQGKKLLVQLVKNFIFKNEAIVASFEESDLNWAENQLILRSMTLKTIKSLTDDEEPAMLTISRDWEDDKEFFLTLFNETLKNFEQILEELTPHLRHWDKERLAAIDRILITMAITEMMSFPNIPVKVSINEYIEVSKNYSTPKSWQFINGLLDTASKELISKGKIRKTGRGLLDNK